MRRPLWRCPKCGHRFVTRNLWHSCGRYDLAHHFEGCDPIVKKLYGRFVKILRACGPVTIYPQKTRIVAMVDVRFANATTTKRALRVHLWLKRKVQHPVLVRHDDYGRLGFGNTFKLERLDQLDGELEALVREAYARDQA